MFYGRTNELMELNKFVSKSNQAAIITGKRRVGKTTLIKELLKGRKCIYFECLKDTIEENINRLVDIIKSIGISIPSYIQFNSFISLFEYLNNTNEKLIVVFDEYPYLRIVNDANVVDSQFQNIIDNHISNLNLIISGSSIKVMNEILNESNPLYGRFRLIIHLKELNYIESSYFYRNKSIYDKIAFYSIFGGSPYINEFIEPKKTLKDNIIETFLNESNGVFHYADKVLISDATNEIQAKRILAVLGNSKKKYSELEQLLDKEKSGKIYQALKSLLELNIVKKVYPINRLTDVKKSYYEINDNVLRFYYSYIYKNKSSLIMIGANQFYKEYIEPTLITFISHRFEELIKDYYSLLVKLGRLVNVLDIGTYYYDDSKNKINGEFDVAIKYNDNKIDIIEVKYFKEGNKLKTKEMEEEIKQIKAITHIRINNVYFISSSGYEENDQFNCIDIESIYNL